MTTRLDIWELYDNLIKAIAERHLLIVLVGADGQVLHGNRRLRETLGYARPDLPRLSLAGLSGDADGAALDGLVRESLADGQIRTGEVPVRCKDGGVVWESVTLHPLAEQGGRIEGIVIIGTDTTHSHYDRLARAAEERAIQEILDGVGLETVMAGVLASVREVLPVARLSVLCCLPEGGILTVGTGGDAAGTETAPACDCYGTVPARGAPTWLEPVCRCPLHWTCPIEAQDGEPVGAILLHIQENQVLLGRDKAALTNLAAVFAPVFLMQRWLLGHGTGPVASGAPDGGAGTAAFGAGGAGGWPGAIDDEVRETLQQIVRYACLIEGQPITLAAARYATFIQEAGQRLLAKKSVMASVADGPGPASGSASGPEPASADENMFDIVAALADAPIARLIAEAQADGKMVKTDIRCINALVKGRRQDVVGAIADICRLAVGQAPAGDGITLLVASLPHAVVVEIIAARVQLDPAARKAVAVLAAGVETAGGKRLRQEGLAGLAAAYRLVRRDGGTISVTTADVGTCFRVSLPPAYEVPPMRRRESKGR